MSTPLFRTSDCPGDAQNAPNPSKTTENLRKPWKIRQLPSKTLENPTKLLQKTISPKTKTMATKHPKHSKTHGLSWPLRTEERMAKACRVIFAACGTSWHSGLIGKYVRGAEGGAAERRNGEGGWFGGRSVERKAGSFFKASVDLGMTNHCVGSLARPRDIFQPRS